MEALRAKFGTFWDSFDAYLRASRVTLSDVDSDTDWDQLLAEVAWPEGGLPNVVQRSALRKALKAYCKLRDASGCEPATGQSHPAPSPEMVTDASDRGQSLCGETGTVGEWLQESRHRSSGPMVGNYARNFSKSGSHDDEPRKVMTATLGPYSCIGASDNHGLSVGHTEDSHTAQLLAECLFTRECVGVKAFAEARRQSAPRVSFTDAAPSGLEPTKHRPMQVEEVAKNPEKDLTEMLDSLLETRRSTADKSDRIFTSVPAVAGQNDLLQLADAMLEREAEHPARKPTRKRYSGSSRLHRKGIPINSESCPAVLNETEKAINDVMHCEFQGYRRQLKEAPPSRLQSALLPNFKGRAESAPKVDKGSLQQRNLELHECLGIDDGTVMQHWLGKWRQRGRPNRGADLELMQETTLQHLAEHRQGRPVEDSWALRNMLRAYGNAHSELLRNMIADETAMKVDQDGDDALNVEEFRQLYRETHPGKLITDDMIRQAWEFADKDHSGEVDFSEMMLWLDRATFDATGIFVPEK
eukprot:GGOE01044391.1.p1 GENE.GGOE01044391.1~~GGOE01044391.1.p1  ORF type:complete len:528 (-),score=111.37 GGOE01044391.1:264-1847(-)